MPQPDDILADCKKAIKQFEDKGRVADRFGDAVDGIGFWVRMAKLLRAELVKSIRRQEQPHG